MNTLKGKVIRKKSAQITIVINPNKHYEYNTVYTYFKFIRSDNMILLAIYYVFSITVLILHFTGHLEAWGMEWLVLVLAATVFPAVLYL